MTANSDQQPGAAHVAVNTAGASLEIIGEGPPDQPFSLDSLLALEQKLVAAEKNPEIYGIAAIWRRPPEGAAAR